LAAGTLHLHNYVSRASDEPRSILPPHTARRFEAAFFFFFGYHLPHSSIEALTTFVIQYDHFQGEQPQ